MKYSTPPLHTPKKSRVRAFFARKFTFLLIPHGSGQSRQINIELHHILFFLAIWTGVTFWGSYLSAQHIDYWRTKLSNHVLKMKVNYLMTRLDESSGFMEEVKDIEGELRELLNYQDEASLIKGDPKSTELAKGGPSVPDQNDVTSLLLGNLQDISWTRMVEKTKYLRDQAKERINSYGDVTNHIALKKKLFRSTPLGWPCPGSVTSHFGKRTDPFSKTQEFHFGVDIGAPSGTPIRATADGVVKIARWYRGYGKLVVIKHDFGYSTRYAHNSEILVKVGDRVERGQKIALMGSTGKASGPHSHYEVWRYNQRKNPYAFLKSQYPDENMIKKVTKLSREHVNRT